VIGRGIVILVPGEVEQRPRRELSLASLQIVPYPVACVGNVGVVAVVEDVGNEKHVLRQSAGSRKIRIKLICVIDVCTSSVAVVDVVVGD